MEGVSKEMRRAMRGLKLTKLPLLFNFVVAECRRKQGHGKASDRTFSLAYPPAIRKKKKEREKESFPCMIAFRYDGMSCDSLSSH